MIKTLTSLLFLFFSVRIFSYEYQLEGPYKLGSSLKSIQYRLTWSEENGKIKGEYSDNHFTQKAPVTGAVSGPGRTFNVILPKSVGGVRSITIISAFTSKKDTGTTIPVGVVIRDEKGSPLTTTDASSQFIAQSSLKQREEERSCREGFGEVAGFCGLYKGLIAEDEDRFNMCDLLFADAARLELTEAAEFILYLGEVNDLVVTPYHLLGRLSKSPSNRDINVSRRYCGPLVQTDFPAKVCKQQTFEGTFTIEDNVRHFTGTYTILDEGTNKQCRYSLSMDQR